MSNKTEYERSLVSCFFRLPNRIFEVGLRPAALTVLAYLISCGGKFHPAIRYIADHTHLTKPTVNRAIAELTANGLLKVSSRSRRGAKHIYEIVPIQSWPSVEVLTLKVGKKTVHEGQVSCPEVGKKSAHIQEEQDYSTRGLEDSESSHQGAEGSEKLQDLLSLTAPLIGQSKSFTIPKIVTSWLEEHVPDFLLSEFTGRLKQHFYPPRGDEFFLKIVGDIQTAWKRAEEEEQRRKEALRIFAQEQIAHTQSNDLPNEE